MDDVHSIADPHTPARAADTYPSRVASLISLVGECCPKRLPRRPVAGLPAQVAHLLRRKRQAGPMSAAAAKLDRLLPGWPEIAVSVIARAARSGMDEQAQRLCALLALRPVARPEPLLVWLDASRAGSESNFWLLVALSGTDTSAVRAAWLDHLRTSLHTALPQPNRALWFAFLFAFLRGWLTYPDFRDSLTAGQVLAAAHPKGDYRRALDRLALSSHPTFSKWYREVTYEVAHQPDVSLSLRDGGWIRDFPGEDYLFDALRRLHQDPCSWWPLHVLRWTSAVDSDDGHLPDKLREFSPLALCLLSLLRPDLCPAAGLALAAPNHRAAVEWLKKARPGAPLDPPWIDAVLAPWTAAAGEPMTLAVGALCSLDPPEDFTGPTDPTLRRRAFIRAHLLPEFDRLLDDLCYLHALRKQHFDTISQLARSGRPPALRALALWPEKAQESAAILFHLTRKGAKLARRAALQSLDLLKQHTGVSDLQHLEKRVDLASAWADAGLEGRPARIWWDIAGYRIRLSVASGRVSLRAYSAGSGTPASRPLASLPKAVREHPGYPEIRDARAHLARGYRYFRRRFEEAMVEGTSYSGSDFAVLLANPMARSLASRLLLMVDDAPFHWTPPDPLDDCHPPAEITRAATVAIAHPLHLSDARALADWQQRVIDARIPQPFKQVFREVYLVGESERTVASCPRFSRHPLIARRAFALLRGRGYAARRGDAVKEWPSHALRAHLHWARPDEDAGRLLAQTDATDFVTSGAVWFESDSGQPLPLAQVPSTVFSETLRDADLLISRAAAGELGFTSEETRRLRATLVRYFARALDLTNVYVGDNYLHALVEGRRAMYRVHLGSGTVLLEDSRRHLDLTSITITRLGDLVAESMDSLTARILGIIVALTRDHQITDPHFLAQLQS
ncbi:MAG: DUF4132 domain-containing protein [Armatimonadota bacterium]|nr:MAG: DUF4132 domain-containing protein [Armatimonadota bacterium]